MKFISMLSIPAFERSFLTIPIMIETAKRPTIKINKARPIFMPQGTKYVSIKLFIFIDSSTIIHRLLVSLI